MIELFFFLLLPTAVVLSGIFLIYQAYQYRKELEQINDPGSGFIVVAGTVSTERPILSYLNEDCVFSRIALEFLDPKRNSWLPLHMFERKTRFMIDELSIDPAGAKIEVVKKQVFQENPKMRPSGGTGIKGTLSEFRYSRDRAISQIPFSRTMNPEPYGTVFDSDILDQSILSQLESDPQIAGLLTQYRLFRKRATLETIKPGDEVVVIGNIAGKSIRKGPDKFLISTDSFENIQKQLTGRQLISAAIGAVLIIISALLFLSF
ncbi:hypothetical protein JXA56_03125 [Candidatus Micrarchaeota archaeon]|nr:hypothetical protein [Candidatus Micrarchaeota archaeon]